MVDVVEEALALSLLAAERLGLEITESLLLQHIPKTRSVLEELRRWASESRLDLDVVVAAAPIAWRLIPARRAGNI